MRYSIFRTALLCAITIGLFAQAASYRPSSYPFISGDTFRSIANHIVDETKQTLNPNHVKPYDIIFLKTDYVPVFFKYMHPQITAQYILITHNSDYSPIYLRVGNQPWQGYDLSHYLDDPKLVIWFAQNIDYVHPKLKPIPIGIGNSYTKHGSVGMFLRATKRIPSLETRSLKIYLNFSVENNPEERQPVMDFFAHKSYAFFAEFKPPTGYLEEMKCYRYVINPPGNGLDCHRTWEALLVGCIPVMKHSLLDPMLEDLPVILIDDWSEVTENFLMHQTRKMHKKIYKLEKIYADYWIKLIKSYQEGR